MTLHEWEHIAEHFENATHYLEKALYKMLSQNIVPLIVTELKVNHASIIQSPIVLTIIALSTRKQNGGRRWKKPSCIGNVPHASP